jgi:predicted amidophosphoribosyltransferase
LPTAEFAKCGPDRELPMVPLPFCRYCATPLSDDYGAWGQCYRCTERLKFLNSVDDEFHLQPYAFERAGAAGLYVSDSDDKGEVGALVLRMKKSVAPVDTLASLVVEAFRRRYSDFKPSVLVPMPSSASKQWQPAVALAGAVAKALGHPVAEALVLDSSYESKRDATQIAKFESCRDKFLTANKTGIAGARVLLIDDVMTTAGHAHWAAIELQKAGAASVHVMVAARTVTLSHLAFIGYSGRV